MDTSLAELFARYVQVADEPAMEEIVRRTRPRLLGVARRIGRAQDAEDTVQTAYHALLRQRPSPEAGPLLGWLITAVVRIAYRRKATEARQSALAERLSLASSCGDPQQDALRAETARILLRTVDRLPSTYRDVLVLHHLQGLSIRETAQLLGLGESTVTTRLQRGRQMLESRLAPQLLACVMFVPWLLADSLQSLTAAPLASGGAMVKMAAAATAISVATVTMVSMTAATPRTDSGAPAATIVQAPRQSTPPREAPLPTPIAAPQPMLLEATLPEQPVESAPPAGAPRAEVSAAPPPDPSPPIVGYRRQMRVWPDALRPLPDQDAPAEPISESEPSELAELDAALALDPQAGMLLLLDRGLERWRRVRSYRARITSTERREGHLEATEQIDYRFHQPDCILLRWLDPDHRGRVVLFVEGLYGNELSIQEKILIKIRLSRDPYDADLLRQANHPVPDSSLGAVLGGLRRLTSLAAAAGDLRVEYLGLVQDPQTGRAELSLVRHLDSRGGYPTTRTVLRFDAATLMPTFYEAHDAEGLLERYEWRGVSLNPTLANGRPELTVEDFRRSTVFPTDPAWGGLRESWTVADLYRAIAAGEGLASEGLAGKSGSGER